MDYKGIKCPVCESDFRENDDIVVCPKCGAPYHRSCYEQSGSCIFIDLHSQNKIWEAPKPPAEEKDEEDSIICQNCDTKNPSDALFCNKCGSSLSENGPVDPNEQIPNPNFQTVYPNARPMSIFIDVMGGYRKEEPVAEDITAGEIFEVVKTNQPYYMNVFHNKQYFGKGKFNFCAFLFSGGWLLYRKINKLGIILTSIVGLLLLAETYLSYAVVSPLMAETMASIGIDISQGVAYSDVFAMTQHLLSTNPEMMLLMCLPSIFNIIRIVIMVICGFKGNSWYFEECKKKIRRAKAKADKNSPEYHEIIYREGGVNTAVAVCLLICNMIIDYIPMLFL